VASVSGPARCDKPQPKQTAAQRFEPKVQTVEGCGAVTGVAQIAVLLVKASAMSIAQSRTTVAQNQCGIDPGHVTAGILQLRFDAAQLKTGCRDFVVPGGELARSFFTNGADKLKIKGT